MTTIKPPPAADLPEGRSLACRQAIEPQFHLLIQQAADAGWSADEIADNMMILAGANLRIALQDRRERRKP